MRKILLALALAAALLAGSAGAASASPATASKSAPLPVLYNLGGGLGSVWNNPQTRPTIFYVFADGSGAVIGMRWARWNHATAVTSKATDYVRSGPCCTNSDQHYVKVTVTLSDVRYRGGPRPGAVLYQDGHLRPRHPHPHVHLQSLPARQPRVRQLGRRRLVRTLISAG